MAKGYRLGEQSIKRVGAVVRQAEAAPRNSVGTPGTPRSGDIGWFNVLNSSGEDIPGRSVAFLDTGTVANGETLIPKVLKVTTAYKRLHCFIQPGGIKNGKTGFATFDSYPVEVKYDSGTPAYGEGWGIKPAQYTLSKGYPGAVCMGVVDSTKKIMLAQFLPITTLLGKLDGTLAQGGSQTVSVWSGPPGSEVDTGWNVTAYDWLMKSGATAIASGKKVWLEWNGNAWYVTQVECA